MFIFWCTPEKIDKQTRDAYDNQKSADEEVSRFLVVGYVIKKSQIESAAQYDQ
jgi:hypothetical protein